MVYFITDGVFTKIGTAKNVNKRLIELQTGNVRKLSILKIIDGGVDVERYVQDIFDKHLSRGEWYEIPKSEILSFVNDFNQNKYYFLQTDLLSSLKLNNFDFIDYKLWEFLVGKRNHKFTFNYKEVSDLCSRRSFFKSKKKYVELGLISKSATKGFYKLNTKYIKNRV